MLCCKSNNNFLNHIKIWRKRYKGIPFRHKSPGGNCPSGLHLCDSCTLSQQVTHGITVDALQYLLVVVVRVRLHQRQSVEALPAQSVKSLIDPVAEVEGCIVPTLCPVGHQVDGDDASAALAAALERSPLDFPKL